MFALSTGDAGFGHFAAPLTPDYRPFTKAITLLENFADLLASPTGSNYDVVIDVSPKDGTTWGNSFDTMGRLLILRGEMFPALNRAANQAGATLTTYTPSADLQQRVKNHNSLMGENVSPSTLGIAKDVRPAVLAMIAKLRATLAQGEGDAPKTPTSRELSSGVKIALAVGAGVVVLGGGYLVLRRR